MITLIDLGQMFWTAYYGFGKSAINAFEYTLEKCEWYASENPGETIVCCDSPVSRRKAINPTYKEKRTEKPKDAIEALRDVQDKIARNGVPVAQSEGYEADDIVATLALQAFPDEVQVIGDEKDFFCMIDGERMHIMGKKGEVTRDDVIKKFDVTPSQMTDFLALMGDAADGIKGAEGIGQKKASALLAAFCDCEGIKAASDEAILALDGFGKKALEGIRAWDPEAALQLVRLEYDAPISLSYLLASDADDSAFPDLD